MKRSIWHTHTSGFMPMHLVMDADGAAMWHAEGEAMTLCNWIDILEQWLNINQDDPTELGFGGE